MTHIIYFCIFMMSKRLSLIRRHVLRRRYHGIFTSILSLAAFWVSHFCYIFDVTVEKDRKDRESFSPYPHCSLFEATPRSFFKGVQLFRDARQGSVIFISWRKIMHKRENISYIRRLKRELISIIEI